MNVLTSLRPPLTDRAENAELRKYFQNTWDLYEWLFSSIPDDSTYYIAPDPLRHPLIFYYGHTAVFYMNKLVMSGVWQESDRIHPRYEQLFAAGVDPATANELDKEINWPGMEEIREYRKVLYDKVINLIEKTEINPPVGSEHPLWALYMGLAHDRIHFETSSVLIRQLPEHLLVRPEGWNYAPSNGAVEAPQWISFSGGTVQLGKPESSQIFGWDNEFGSLEINVLPFEAESQLFTNARFLEFVLDGGYEQEKYWTAEGWKWRLEQQVSHPKFWVPDNKGAYRYRAMFDDLDMPLDWPVEVNFHEAEACINWLNNGSRLLSEAEYNHMTADAPLKNGDSIFSENYNLNIAFGSPSPVGHFKEGRTPSGIDDPYGNVWQWLRDDFYALPGFRTHPLYEDFSAPYMDEAHSMMLGGSWASTGSSASRYYRLWFRRYFYQHAGFRLARDL